ncbi:MAG: TonB-dependent receptor plug domain-containing protein [Alphaproteobacteria bacterium]
MQKFSLKSQLAVTASAALLAGLLASPVYAQDSGNGAGNSDEIITTGTRRKARSAADTPAPVDVISGVEFTNQASNDLQDLLRTSVPSYNVNAQPISDAATIIRPANLRGLSPDNTLVLLNGKRRHRGSVISFLGGGIADGAQGVDISVFPALALKQVEVLRDGASSQYGSDAIAGVINFQLKDAREGGMVEAVYGQTFEGDGVDYRVSGNAGFALGERGFVNVTAEYSQTEGTVRAAPRDDVTDLVAAGNTAAADNLTINNYTDKFAQYWGTPDINDNIKLFVNSGYEISDSAELYLFGNYAERQAEGGFFYRNPTNRGGVYSADGGATLLVGDLNPTDGISCPVVNITDTTGNGSTDTPDPVALAAVQADPNCFTFATDIPGGFVPRFGGNNEDMAIVGGIRGELEIGNGFGYDFSANYGQNSTEFFINNTVNASLGPNTPRDFVPGAYEQTEVTLNADFNYSFPMSEWASDLNFAFGGEYREETFDVTAGDAASFALGPLAQPSVDYPTGQGFSTSSNGFGGFSRSTSNKQDSFGVYGELEADLSEVLTMQAALRYEDFSAFGDTLNYKIAALVKLTDTIRLRGAYSTGFHAPTAGQANVTNVTTQIVNGTLIDQGTVPLSSGPGQLAADFILDRDGGRPELGTEDARNISFGTGFETGPISWTIDYFNIDVDNRIALANDVDFLQALDFAADTDGDGTPDAAGYDGSSVASAITTLDTAGIINRAEYVGFEALTQFRYFSNSFDTKTQGIDIIAKAPLNFIKNGSTNATLAVNYTETKVNNTGTINPISGDRVLALEELLPNWKGNLTVTHERGKFRGLVRANYYGGWNDNPNGYEPGAEFLFDAEVGYEVHEGMELIAGAANLLNNYSDKNPGQGGTGQLYPESGPFGFNGGQWYVKARYTF